VDVALEPDSEAPDLSLPEDYKHDHPDEHPSDWGWHGEWGRAARIAGWIVAAILLLMITATHYNHSGTMWLLIFTGGIVVGEVWDIHRRRNAWRR
jgi:hypothetical protein